MQFLLYSDLFQHLFPQFFPHEKENVDTVYGKKLPMEAQTRGPCSPRISLYLMVGAREPQSPDTVTSSANQPLLLLVLAQNKGKDTRVTGVTHG